MRRRDLADSAQWEFRRTFLKLLWRTQEAALVEKLKM